MMKKIGLIVFLGLVVGSNGNAMEPFSFKTPGENIERCVSPREGVFDFDILPINVFEQALQEIANRKIEIDHYPSEIDQSPLNSEEGKILLYFGRIEELCILLFHNKNTEFAPQVAYHEDQKHAIEVEIQDKLKKCFVGALELYKKIYEELVYSVNHELLRGLCNREAEGKMKELAEDYNVDTSLVFKEFCQMRESFSQATRVFDHSNDF